MLSPQDRERFLLVVAKFRNVPQDDEYLLVLEAIGFMTLLWKAVPKEIQAILENANPVTGTSAEVAKVVGEAVTQAIPSQQDLRTIAQSLREHETALRNLSRVATASSDHSPAFLILALVFGLTCLVLLAERIGLLSFGF